MLLNFNSDASRPGNYEQGVQIGNIYNNVLVALFSRLLHVICYNQTAQTCKGQELVQIIFYSVLRASIGSKVAAFEAG